MTKYHIALEGLPCAFKSTVINTLSGILDSNKISILPEPLKDFTNFKGIDLLHNLYSNPKKYAFETQVFFTHIMYTNMKRALKSSTDGVLTERSIFSTLFFVKALHEADYLTDNEYIILQNIIEDMIEDIYGDANLNLCVIYLDIDPDVSYTRIKRRGRLQEQNITLSYLNKVKKAHDVILFEKALFVPYSLYRLKSDNFLDLLQRCSQLINQEIELNKV